MPEDPLGFSSRTDDLSRVEVLLAIARMKGAILSTKEVDELTGLLPPGCDLRAVWNQFPNLDSQYELQGELLVEKNAKSTQFAGSTEERSTQRRMRADRYLEHAREFSFLSGKRWIRVLSVAGSTSYKDTSKDDDVDIFCVTEKDSVWIYLTKALLIARAYKMIRPRSPRFCFSCVLDEEYATTLFASPKDALFARDALTTKVLQGSSFYNNLLRRGPWLSDYFPKLLRMSKTQHLETTGALTVPHSSLVRKMLNQFLFLAVGNYVKLKSTLLNRKLRRKGRLDSLFTILSGYDHCVFESRGYQELRRIYRDFKPHSTHHQPPYLVKAESAP